MIKLWLAASLVVHAFCIHPFRPKIIRPIDVDTFDIRQFGIIFVFIDALFNMLTFVDVDQRVSGFFVNKSADVSDTVIKKRYDIFFRFPIGNQSTWFNAF